LDDVRIAVGTDAVAEGRPGVLLDIGLDLLPVVLVVAYLLAVGADGKQPLKALLPLNITLSSDEIALIYANVHEEP